MKDWSSFKMDGEEREEGWRDPEERRGILRRDWREGWFLELTNITYLWPDTPVK